MSKKAPPSDIWTPSVTYTHGDVIIDRTRRPHRIRVMWDDRFHDCGLEPTDKNIEAMVNLFQSLKGKP